MECETLLIPMEVNAVAERLLGVRGGIMINQEVKMARPPARVNRHVTPSGDGPEERHSHDAFRNLGKARWN